MGEDAATNAAGEEEPNPGGTTTTPMLLQTPELPEDGKTNLLKKYALISLPEEEERNEERHAQEEERVKTKLHTTTESANAKKHTPRANNDGMRDLSDAPSLRFWKAEPKSLCPSADAEKCEVCMAVAEELTLLLRCEAETIFTSLLQGTTWTFHNRLATMKAISNTHLPCAEVEVK